MKAERARLGSKLALLSAALFLLVAACGEEGVEPTEQGAAPATEGEQQ